MRLFIGGSVSENIGDLYIQKANQFADYIIQKQYDVICCGDLRGIIGRFYYSLKKTHKADVLLTAPKIYLPYAKDIIDEIDYTPDTINEANSIHLEKSDVCIFLPGGIGTLYEILSAIESKRAGEQTHPILIINLFGIYDSLETLLHTLETEKFILPKDNSVYTIVTSIEDAISYLESLNHL